MKKTEFQRVTKFLYGLSTIGVVLVIIGLFFVIGLFIFNVSITLEFPGVSFLVAEEMKASYSYNIGLFINVLMLLFSIILFRKMFRNFSKNQIFIKENFTLMRNIGILTIISTIPEMIHNYIQSQRLLDHFADQLENIRINISLNNDRIFFGIVFIIFAEIFKYSIALKEESDLTI